MTFDYWTLALQTVNFLVLVWLMHRFLYKPILRMIDLRRAEVEKAQTEAEASKAAARAELAAVDSRRAAIDRERSEILREAVEEAEKLTAERHARAEGDAAALLAAGHEKLAAERAEALSEARLASLDFGLDIARRLLGEVPAALRAEAWLEKIEDTLAALPAERRAGLAEAAGGDLALRVVTATRLADATMEEWRKRLDRALGNHAAITFDVDPELVAGAELYFPHAILRFSWRDSLATLREKIEAHDTAP
jgi:F-type H+-transporting ATPase subunit b